MIITCPQCATRYDVEETAFVPDGRKVKCTSCSFTWFQVPVGTEPGPEPELAAEPELEPQDSYAQELQEAEEPATDVESEAAKLAAASRAASASFAQRRAQRQSNLAGWSTFAAIVCVLVSIAYFGRTSVVAMFPASAGLYESIGLPVNVRGLEFAEVEYYREFENGVPVLSVSGEIVNVTSETVELPRLRFGLLDDEQHEVYHWTMAVSRDPLSPADSVRFSTRLAAPPESAQHVQIRFAQGS